jgi:large subunit ribosomal protein L18e
MRKTLVMLERTAKKQGAPIWATASRLLGSPAVSKVEVNLGRISRISREGEAVFVPGKVLGNGMLDKKLVVGAFAFSASAKNKITAMGGSALSVEEFVKKFPEGSGVKLVG